MSTIALALSSENGGSDLFGENALQVEYTDDTASFIGVACSELFDCSVYGVDPFDTPARELFRLLAERDGTRGAPFPPMKHCFRNLVATLYDADEQYDRKGGGARVIWGQIGVGDARYLAAIDAIRA